MSTLLSSYESRYPAIEWREPVEVDMPAAKGLACRVCIAAQGLRADETDRLFASREDFDRHFVVHLKGKAPGGTRRREPSRGGGGSPFSP